MAAFKNITHIPFSPIQTNPIKKEFKKTTFFSSSYSSQQFLANQKLSAEDAKFYAKNSSSSRHVWKIKALTEEERDLVGEDGNKEKGISNGREVKDDKERLLNAAIVLGAGSLAITRLLTIDHDYWHVRALLFSSILSPIFLISIVNISILLLGFWFICTNLKNLNVLMSGMDSV